MIITTRGYNSELYSKTREFLPENIVKIWINGLNGPNDSSEYLHRILKEDTDWVINIDEDCFVYDWSKVEGLINYMEKNDYHYAGMPDGGVCSTRARSWVVMNPFFNIFDVKYIRKEYNKYTKEEIDAYKINGEHKIPEIITKPYNHGLISPFNGLFNWLHYNFKPLYLNARDHVDSISTYLLDHTGVDFALHSWYSREYNNDTNQKERINQLYNQAKNYTR